MAKRYFAEQGVEFEAYDVSVDREALRRMVTLTGQFGVPVVLVGEKAMIGWDPTEFERLMEH